VQQIWGQPGASIAPFLTGCPGNHPGDSKNKTLIPRVLAGLVQPWYCLSVPPSDVASIIIPHFAASRRRFKPLEMLTPSPLHFFGATPQHLCGGSNN